MFKELLQERYPLLPKDIQELIKSSKIGEVISQIATQQNISEDGQASIVTQVFMILLGISPQKDLERNIIEQAALSPEKASSVANQIASSLFVPVQASLNVLAKELEEASTTETVPVTEVSTSEHTPETDTDHMLEPGVATPDMPIKKVVVSINVPVKTEVSPTNPFNLDPQPQPSPEQTMTMEKPLVESNPDTVRTLENDMKQDPIISQKLAGMSTLPKKEVFIAPVKNTPASGDPYREAPVA